MKNSCKIGKNNMRHLKTYEHFQTNENVFGNLLSKIGDKIKTLKGKAFIKLMRTILPKPILSEIDKVVGVKESHVILELFDYSDNINWEKMSQEEIDDFLKYFSKSQNFVSSIENPDRIISSTGNKEILNILKERGIDVPVQIVSKNTPDLKNILSKVDSLNVPTFVKGFLKVAACVVLFGMISFKLSSGIPSGETDSNFSDLDSEHDHNHSVSDSDFSELVSAAEEAGVDVNGLKSEILTDDKNFFENFIQWICEFLGIEPGEENTKKTEKDVKMSLDAYFKVFYESESKGISDFEPFIEETKNIVKAQISVDKNIPENVKSSLYDRIDKCKPTVLDTDDYDKLSKHVYKGTMFQNKVTGGFYANDGEHDFIFIKYSDEKLEDYRRNLIHELFHLVDLRTDGKLGMSDELVGKGFWDFLKPDLYDNEDEYDKNYRKIFGQDPKTGKYDKEYLMGTDLTYHEIYVMLKVMKNDLVKVGLLDSLEDPVSTELLDEIFNGEHKDKLDKITDDQWKKILPIIRKDDNSITKFSKFLSQVVDEPNKFNNLA